MGGFKEASKIKYSVPSRIAINLYDMNGNLGRIDGGMGFSLEYPRMVFTVEPAESIIVDSNTLMEKELTDAVQNALNITKDKYLLGGIRITIHEAIPEHSGFGSKTAALLSTAHAYCNIYNKKAEFKELAAILRRGGTSGLGINLIDKGGFGLEGGHSTKYKSEFGPSSTIKIIQPAPLLARYDMPDWKILLLVPDSERVFGKKEFDFFKSICPIPEEDIEKLARITLSKMLPAVCESDLESFCQGINLVQEKKWKKNEINLYGPVVQDIINFSLANGALGAGMSSIGPCVYAFGDDLESLSKKIEKETPHQYKMVRITKPDNFGLKIMKCGE
jgi:beta-ribofuranosylaminobenzene 5'-phosphate synthase